MRYRKLTQNEIDTLIQQDCRCDNWELIEVAENFNPATIRNTNFSGQIFLGVFEKEFVLFGGVKRPAGISNATIHNCTIGNNVYIGQVRNYIANYVIEDDVFIDNVDLLAVDGISSFGNNVKAAVLSETGGREIPIFDHLSAQMAYFLTLYRHRPLLIEKLCDFIQEYTNKASSTTGHIGRGSHIAGCRTIKNVKIGECAHVNGVYRLYNGTVNSCSADPTHVGSGVVADNFIFATGANIDDGTVIHSCFIGQGCILSKQYSAENSLFFANSAGFHGEACSIFAGPFTVTHHKSTLLIAGLFSFMNAGSGSNQSNHMYKLGPIHQGIMERGAKTSSDSYILWPAKVGAFTLVMGRHYKHSDTSEIPFSYLIEHNDESVLIPGINLSSVGTIRDAQKWPKRDNRKDSRLLDLINFNLLSPYTIHKMMCAVKILQSLQNISGVASETYSYNNTIIRNSALNKGLLLYNIAIAKFLGNSLISRIEKGNCKSNKELQELLKPTSNKGLGAWVDIAGMIAPKDEITRLIDDVENGTIRNTEMLHDALNEIHSNYYDYEWTWAYDKLHYLTDKPVTQLTADDVIEMVKKWKDAVIELDKKLYDNAKKEFTLDSKISFGTDGDEDERNLDFEQVRGEFEKNPFVQETLKHIEKKSALAQRIIDKMKLIHS